MKLSNLKQYLEGQFPEIKFYNSTIDRNESECVGLYLKGGAQASIALGGAKNTTYGKMPITILVHWSENSSKCEATALLIYNHLFGLSKITMGDSNIVSVDLIDPHPRDVGRDNNICEMVIRAIIVYEREVQE